MSKSKISYFFQKIKNIYHLGGAIIANFYFRYPSRRIKVIGVTGTDGKTTTTALIYHILTSAGKKASYITSISAKVAGNIIETGLHTTTPGSFFLQRLIRQAVGAGEEYFILETTSHALDQYRNYGIRYKLGVITNVTPEHLDYHRTYSQYLRAKAKLLLNSDVALINADDSSVGELKKILSKEAVPYHTYGISEKAEFMTDFRTHLERTITDYNNLNYLAAYGACRLLGISDGEIIPALNTFELPLGRYDVVYKGEYEVIIDFAHTSNSLLSLLGSIRRTMNKKGRLIHVFGSAGGRDFAKRPVMGAASGANSDIVILTEEDYRQEDPERIADEIAIGLLKNGFKKVTNTAEYDVPKKSYFVILERAQAIKKAIDMARDGDTVVLTGKSHEKSLARGRREWQWDEKEAVRQALTHKHDTTQS